MQHFVSNKHHYRFNSVSTAWWPPATVLLLRPNKV